MIIFIGSAEKGYFAEEIAEKKGKEFAYVKSNSRIELQKTEILEHQGVEYMIFDIQQYLDSAEEIAKQIITIRNCNNATVIIYASGYMLKNKVLVMKQMDLKNWKLLHYRSRKKNAGEKQVISLSAWLAQ